jgi:Bacterial Ig domain
VTATVDRVANSETPITVDETYAAEENATLAAGPGLDQPGLLDNDYDLDGDRLQVTSFTWQEMTTAVPSGGTGSATYTATGATLSVSSNGGFRYTPSSGYVGGDSFTYSVVSSAATTTGGTATITIAPLSAIVTVPAPLNFPQSDTSQDIGGIILSDANAGSSDVEATFAVEQGTLSLLTSGATGGVTAGDVFDNGTAEVTVYGTLSEINTTLATAGGLTYTEPSAPSGSDDLGISDDLSVTLNKNRDILRLLNNNAQLINRDNA